MKKILFILLVAAAPSYAQIVPTALSTTTVCSPISVSSSIPTAVFTPAPAPVSPFIQVNLSAYNTSGSSQVFCSQDVAVSSQGAHMGWPVNTQNYRDWTILPYQPWNCAGGSTIAPITVVICLTR